MKRTSLTRRLLAGAAGLTIGVAGALAIASPAFAHNPVAAGEGFCDQLTGEQVVTWVVGTDSPLYDAIVKNVTLTVDGVVDPDAEFSTITEGAVIPKLDEDDNQEALQEQQRFPGDTGDVSLEVTVDFVSPDDHNDVIESGKTLDEPVTVTFEGPCEERELEFGFSPVVTCDLLLFLVINDGEEDGVGMALTPNQDAVHGHAPGIVELLEDDDFVEGTGFVVDAPADVLDVVGPLGAGETFGPITVGNEEPNNFHAHGFQGADGLEVTIELFVGDALVGAPSFSWDDLFAVADERLDCEEDDGEGGGEPELPVTGSPSLMIAGGALLLLVLGGVMYLLARRRRVTFTV